MQRQSVKKLALMAMLIALQVVFSKFLMLQLSGSVRLSIDSVPILLSGLWLGPVAGLIVGGLGDLVGTALFPTAGAYFPPLTAAFMLIGLTAGLIGRYVEKKPSFSRCAVLVFAAELIGSYLWKGLALSWLYGIPVSALLVSRALPVFGVAAADTLLVYSLNRLLSDKLRATLCTESAPTPAVPAAPMDYDEALTYIHSVTWRGSRLGLERTHELLARAGRPDRKLRFIHIAGTNGKGSTAAMLASILQSAGYKTGLYTSPFITRFNERMRINGCDIPDDVLAEITNQIRPLADDMADHPTEFELITVIALVWFARSACDVVVLEVGMGGELDSTNVIDTPELAVITNIGLDHTRELGPTITDIARAKAGIIKDGGDVVAYGLNDEANAVFDARCREKHARIVYANHARIQNITAALDGLTFDFLPWTALSCALIGAYQPHNAAVALTAVEILRQKGWVVSDEAVRRGLSAVRWPARFEILCRKPLFVADGGHNPQGIEAAADSIRLHLAGKKPVILLGIMADKDIPHMIDRLAPLAECFVTVTPNNPRAISAEDLAAKLVSLGCRATACDAIDTGVAEAIRCAGPDGAVCALGSLYLLGDVRECVAKRFGPPESK